MISKFFSASINKLLYKINTNILKSEKNCQNLGIVFGF
jgi:hypothetical protein